VHGGVHLGAPGCGRRIGRGQVFDVWPGRDDQVALGIADQVLDDAFRLGLTG